MVKIVSACLFCLLLAANAHAQQPAATVTTTPQANGDEPFNIESDNNEIADGHRIDCGRTSYELPGGIKFFADCIDYEFDTKKIVARGNVVFTQPRWAYRG